MTTDLQTISWDNSKIYKNFQDPKIQHDLNLVVEKTLLLKNRIKLFEDLVNTFEQKTKPELIETLSLAREAYKTESDLTIILYTIGTYASTAASVNSLDPVAKELLGKVRQMLSDLKKISKPLHVFLMRAPSFYIDEFLKDESVNEHEFKIRHDKENSDFLLSVAEEVALQGHSVDGFTAWSELYDDISGAMKLQVDGEEMGLAQAFNILVGDDREKREKAYRARNEAWVKNEIPAAAILNSLSGWRLENYKTRSKKRELHYLDLACHEANITRNTLDALMKTTYEQRNVGLDALKLMAKEIGTQKLAPWDLLAPYPNKSNEKKVSFPEAMEIICSAFARVSPEMADFAKMMADKKWIDATPSQNRQQGAYCTEFAGPREPRVFITYDGSMKNIITLAHELGHAYHSWVMRDMKYGQTSSCPNTLAETASLFAETLVREALLEKATSTEEKKKILWQELDSAAGLLINIPARFEFEKNLFELRKLKVVRAEDMKKLTREAWALWYGDTLFEYDEMFWASKLHFSRSTESFYNYPYLFGYLFGLGIYAKKNEYGSGFIQKYIELLRDTGAMTAEDLIKKHFDEDITKSEFWLKPLKIVENSIKTYAALETKN